jgi:hypothetical protein
MVELMKIKPLAADSLGVRSMATYITTKNCKILIDPGAALGPSRYGLPPAPQEFSALEDAHAVIATYAKKSDILVISHYHYDHYTPEETFYAGRTLYAKSISEHINRSQKLRGTDFKSALDALDTEPIYCDDKQYRVGDTTIKFSPPFPHGPEGVRLGFVVMTTIDDQKKRRVLHASDVQGPVSSRATEYIIAEHPDILIIDGPPTLFLGWKFSRKNLADAIENMLKIIKEVNCEIILDHHLLRDLNYKTHLEKVYAHGNIKTAAEYIGKENNFLEAHRKTLWAEVRAK